eukprot:gene8137-12598_t
MDSMNSFYDILHWYPNIEVLDLKVDSLFNSTKILSNLPKLKRLEKINLTTSYPSPSLKILESIIEFKNVHSLGIYQCSQIITDNFYKKLIELNIVELKLGFIEINLSSSKYLKYFIENTIYLKLFKVSNIIIKDESILEIINTSLCLNESIINYELNYSNDITLTSNFNFIKENKNIKILKLECIKLSKYVINYINNSMKYNNYIEEYIISNSNYNQFSFLEENKKIKKLYMNNMSLNNENIILNLMKSINKNKNIITLSLDRTLMNQSNNIIIQFLNLISKNESIKTLIISGAPFIKNRNINEISNILINHSTITKLDCNSSLRSISCLDLLDSLNKNNTLKSINLYGSSIGKKESKKFSNLKIKNNTIEEIILDEMNGSFKKDCFISQLLNIKSLKKLYLRKNYFDKIGIRYLSNYLKYSNDTKLEYLVIGNESFNNNFEIFKLFISSLKYNTKLKYLHLDYGLKENEVEFLIEIILQNNTIQSLNFECQYLSSKYEQLVLNFIKSNHLNELIIDSNQFKNLDQNLFIQNQSLISFNSLDPKILSILNENKIRKNELALSFKRNIKIMKLFDKLYDQSKDEQVLIKLKSIEPFIEQHPSFEKYSTLMKHNFFDDIEKPLKEKLKKCTLWW